MEKHTPQDTSPSLSQRELVGMWHKATMVASGQSDTFYFFEDQTFIFFSAASGILHRFSGTWHVDDSSIELAVEEVVYLRGGEVVPTSTSSFLPQYEIVDAAGEIEAVSGVSLKLPLSL